MSEERFDRIDERLDRVEAGLSGVAGRLDDLGRHMRMLHEEAMDRIAATREYNGPTQTEVAELKEMLGRRLDPLEAVVRQHSGRIERLEHGRRRR